MGYDAIVLDYDGVVVRVVPAEKRAPPFRERLADRFRDERLELDDSLVESLVHSVSTDTLRSLSDRTGLDDETLWKHRDDALYDVLHESARDGEKSPYDDVDTLFELGVPLGVASNNQKRLVDAINREYGLAEQFETIHARDPHPDSLTRKKPEPDYLEAAIADLGAEEPIYVGDRESDLLAGQRAGVDTALLRRSHNADLRVETEPTYEVDSLDAVADIVGSTA